MAAGDLGLRAEHVRVIMLCMRIDRVTGCAAAMLVLLSACQVQQQQQQQPGIEPNIVAEENAPDGEKPQSTGKPDSAAPAAEGEDSHEHVCSGLLSCKLGLCPNGKKRRQQAEAREQEEQNTPARKETKSAAQIAQEAPAAEEEPEDSEPVTPSAEQMEAARTLMAAQAKPGKKKPRRKEPQATEPEPVEVPAPAPEPAVVADNSSGIPGRSGLRMGHFAPPEEAASRGDKTAPRPNAAERHGLRSPSLPKSLPMNIDGQTHAH